MSEHPANTRSGAAEPDEFYIGYLPKAPARTARTLRTAIAGLLVLSAASAAVTASAFRPPSASHWDDHAATFTGWFQAAPYAVLRSQDSAGAPHAAVLVGAGKHGPGTDSIPRDQWVSVRGTAIRRDGRTVIELAGYNAVTGAATPSFTPAAPVPRGRATLRGEIIDPKCFMGAMKPGDGKLHKACAVRCIAGGIPPMLAVPGTGAAGSETIYYLLVHEDGSPLNTAVLPYVGEPVEVSGAVEQLDDLFVLRTRAESIRPL